MHELVLIIIWFNFPFDRPGHLQQSHQFSKRSPDPNHILPQYLIRLRSGTDFLQISQKCGLNTFHPPSQYLMFFMKKTALKKATICLYVCMSHENQGYQIAQVILLQLSSKIFKIFLHCYLNICLFLKLVLQVRSFNRCTQSQTICLLLQESNHWETHLDRLFLKQQEFKDTTNIASLVC